MQKSGKQTVGTNQRLSKENIIESSALIRNNGTSINRKLHCYIRQILLYNHGLPALRLGSMLAFHRFQVVPILINEVALVKKSIFRAALTEKINSCLVNRFDIVINTALGNAQLFSLTRYGQNATVFDHIQALRALTMAVCRAQKTKFQSKLMRKARYDGTKSRRPAVVQFTV